MTSDEAEEITRMICNCLRNSMIPDRVRGESDPSSGCV